MRVLVTGGTGFVGSHSVKALVDAGHQVRLLVRAPERIAPALAPLGLDGADHVVGDVMDAAAVERALEGCDAVLHAANVYKIDSRAADEMLEVNPRSTELVLRAAHARGLDPIVHVSTTVCMLPSSAVLTPDAPVGEPPGAYARSKAEAERIARAMQQEGAPVVTVYPGGILGPHDPRGSDFVEIAHQVITGQIPLRPRGATPAVDVRDVAAVHAALFEPGRGPRRFIASAGEISLEGLAATARRLTGRRIPGIPMPARLVLAGGRLADLAQRVLPFRLPVSYEGPWLMVQDARADATATTEQLGVRFRPVEETLADTYRWLWQAGRLSRRQAGRMADEPAPAEPAPQAPAGS